MMGFYDAAFIVFGAITGVSAVLVVAQRNLIHSAVALFFCLTGVAGLYILLGADFLGVVQILVYAGGILVLIIFGVFLTTDVSKAPQERGGPRLPRAVGIVVAAALFLTIVTMVRAVDWPETSRPMEPTTAALGEILLTTHVLPFELISLVLLMAMVGSVFLVRKEGGGRP